MHLWDSKHCCDAAAVCVHLRSLPPNQNYLSSRGKSWRDLRQEALQTLEQGKYYLSGELACYVPALPPCSVKEAKPEPEPVPALLSDPRIAADAVLCYCCGLRAFKELAYKYRQSIPSSELPGQTPLWFFCHSVSLSSRGDKLWPAGGNYIQNHC